MKAEGGGWKAEVEKRKCGSGFQPRSSSEQVLLLGQLEKDFIISHPVSRIQHRGAEYPAVRMRLELLRGGNR
jgi:hypothetical protein